MDDRLLALNPTRRQFVLTGASATLLVALVTDLSTPVLAQERAPDNKWREMYDKLIGSAKAVQGKLTLEMPELAENGNLVPFTLSVDSPMTAADHVKDLYVLSTANPQADVAVFHLTPLSGKAAVSGRMRLASTQDVIAVAALSDGSVLTAQRTVKVTIGGCGG
jgi:sulfur-oxidizing protein SoxY